MLGLPTECVLDFLRFLRLPILGRVAITSCHFNAVANVRIHGKESSRAIDKLAIFEDCIGIVQGSHFREMPIPERLPPWNLHIKSVTVYCSIGPRVARFLRLLTSIQPCNLHLDGSRFARQFGARNWPNNVQKVVLSKCAEYAYDSGRSLLDIFNDQNCLFRLLEIRTLECHLVGPDYGQVLLMWLNHAFGQENNINTRRRHHSSSKQRILKLRGEAPEIAQFLRDARQNFATSLEPANFQVCIECGHFLQASNWADHNWRTREQLEFRKMANGSGNKRSANFFSLERSPMDADLDGPVESAEEMEMTMTRKKKPRLEQQQMGEQEGQELLIVAFK